ncbi:MAG TPA: Do family serine endopeptidase [Devosiaceae bacterium]|nr:Do family serine endopeptidase [Devosiaceae bacterium]
MSSRTLVMIAAALVLVGGGAITGSLWSRDANANSAVNVTTPMPVSETTPVAPAPMQVAQADIPAVTREVPQSPAQMQLSFAPIVKRVAPAVVNVYATTITRQTNSPFANDPFFGRLFGQGGPFSQSRPRESESLGSGVIIDPSGIIVTNNHVVNGATDVKVAVQDGHQYDVDVLLHDAKTDLAVLRIKNPGGRTFPALQFANSDSLQVGDLVLAIGNPFGVGQTVTSGIVSALGRTGVESSDYEAFIQTDAAINPGNSGGALVDLSGHLVGINTAIFTQSGGSVGIGFAIPANLAKTVAYAGEHGGKLILPWLGARLQDVTQDIANSLNIEPPRGAMVTEVAAESPAATAGLKSGDVITAIDGAEVDEPQSLNYRVATKPIGSTAKLTFIRGGQRMETAVKLEPAPDGTGETVEITGDTRFDGASATTLSPAIAQQYGLPFTAKGVVVTNVQPNSPADQMGLQAGDIVLSLNGTNITNADTFKRVATSGASGWQIAIQRAGQLIRTYIDG